MQTLKDGECKDDLPTHLRPKSGYTNTYAKMWWQQPAPTITRNFATPSSSRCIHPRDSRALSIREGARLQSFPDDFVFAGSHSAKRLQIGNAVPPLVSIAQAKFRESLSAKDIIANIDFSYIDLLNSRLCEIFTRLNSLYYKPCDINEFL